MNEFEILENYKNKDKSTIEYIENIVLLKNKIGNWDTSVDGKSNDLLIMLLYEYATSIEKLTDKKITSKQVIDKISENLGIFRLGDFKPFKDDRVAYDKLSVTSDRYKTKCRIENKFGAHAVDYTEINSDEKVAIVLFDNNQVAKINGTEYKLSGIDLSDLSDIRHTFFHELTHIMERCKVNTSQLSKDDIIFTNGTSIYINTMPNPNMGADEYKRYIKNLDYLFYGNRELKFSGISTVELKGIDNDKRVIHNQIDEGAVEFIARKVMETIGEEVKDTGRYSEQVKIVGNIFERNGLSNMLTTYLTESNKIIRILENTQIKGKDLLHYISDYINSSKLLKRINRRKLDSINFEIEI